MPAIPPLSAEDAPEAARAGLSRASGPTGRFIRYYGVLANAPAALDGFLDLKQALQRGALPFEIRERIAVRVAQANGCEYCLSAHAGALRRSGVPEEEILAAQEGRSTDPRARAVLALVDAILARASVPPEADALTAEERLETAANVALNVFSNAVNALAATELDIPRVPLAPTAPN